MLVLHSIIYSHTAGMRWDKVKPVLSYADTREVCATHSGRDTLHFVNDSRLEDQPTPGVTLEHGLHVA